MMRYRTKHATRRAVKQAAFWAAFFVMASVAVTLASFVGAELTGYDGSRSAVLGLAGLGISIVLVLAVIGLLCSLAEDSRW